tara:strand:+ start:1815 stop:2276 length:462 start_codon:yes stop_codon:yes gene_type:complete
MTKKEKKSTEKKKNITQQIEETKSVVIPPDAIIQVPISGNFRHAIEDTLNFIMSPMTADDIVQVMNLIKTDFKDIPKEEITIVHKSVWTLLSLINEINYQAHRQKKTVVVDETIKSSLSEVLYNATDENIENVIKDKKEFSEKEFGKDISTSD